MNDVIQTLIDEGFVYSKDIGGEEGIQLTDKGEDLARFIVSDIPPRTREPY